MIVFELFKALKQKLLIHIMRQKILIVILGRTKAYTLTKNNSIS